ncbi:phytanoyl-CoA dioxygenase family protein [Pseudobacteriovorax antillogorgiicola]|uniref:Ectoine hydroxylase-related dioxygenase, phytanoyl-CoA dioxygenase (PhyH) family n=1 Tax=Pseudobacteriovorax antillogorgiicola TaxID=1513793 RepID=A0A1Y6BBG1_9BACT|nr:phytanoyl-CoA dioxygenase family protein [Pseudobacteriovorax antillogorgiicola]TCS57316.1 ectoine hydroxylase-related dioxygenase (phytanoyl-CoA dioxygenase family) [Pseudobacteriovorax antillogorgiicola]SMF02610.1 Ectoine hydroxylase-related dioxygenase, phytanoyl-CoA dioxygenase (PhyH) family [Pseudobacteriovorax antillogorgiicola]
MRLSQAQIDEFYEIGFLVLENLFHPEEIDQIGKSFDIIAKLASRRKTTFHMNGTQFVVNGDRIDRVVWCAGVQPQLLEFAHSKRLLGPVSQILGSQQISQLICQAHFKFPKDGVAFPWHQDSEHRKFGSEYWSDINGLGSYVQCLLAVDDVTPENGPVHFVPRSCQQGHLYLEKHPEQRESFQKGAYTTPELKAGSLVLFGPYTVHGSQANSSLKPRRVFINGFCYPGANRFSYPGCDTGLMIDVPQS